MNQPRPPLSYHAAPTTPRGRTWVPLVPIVAAKARALNRMVHSPQSRPPAEPTRDLGRAVFGHEAALVHLAPEVVVGAEGLEPWCLSGTPGAIGSPYHDRCASDGKLEAVSPEHEPTLTPDTIVPCGWPGCEIPYDSGGLPVTRTSTR